MTWSGQQSTDQWFWCLKHGAVEGPEGCRAEERMGPYKTREEAENWREKVAERNEAWEKQDADDE